MWVHPELCRCPLPCAPISSSSLFCSALLQAASKYNSQYHKLFKDIPTEESVLKGGRRGAVRGRRCGATGVPMCRGDLLAPSLAVLMTVLAARRSVGELVVKRSMLLSPGDPERIKGFCPK